MKLLQGDCLELMKDIPDGSIDMILCDMPYGNTACKWDNRLDLGAVWAQYRRIIKPVGVIALFGCEPFSTLLRYPALDLYKYDWYWVKSFSTGFLDAHNKPMKKVECISIFSGGVPTHIGKSANRMPYNPQGLKKRQAPLISGRKIPQQWGVARIEWQNTTKHIMPCGRITLPTS